MWSSFSESQRDAEQADVLPAFPDLPVLALLPFVREGIDAKPWY